MSNLYWKEKIYNQHMIEVICTVPKLPHSHLNEPNNTGYTERLTPERIAMQDRPDIGAAL